MLRMYASWLNAHIWWKGHSNYQIRPNLTKSEYIIPNRRYPVANRGHIVNYLLWTKSYTRHESSMGANLPRNKSSWNLRSRGTKVPQERKFQAANVPWNESSTGAKVLSMVTFSLPGTKVQRNEKAWNRSCPIIIALQYGPDLVLGTSDLVRFGN